MSEPTEPRIRQAFAFSLLFGIALGTLLTVAVGWYVPAAVCVLYSLYVRTWED